MAEQLPTLAMRSEHLSNTILELDSAGFFDPIMDRRTEPPWREQTMVLIASLRQCLEILRAEAEQHDAINCYGDHMLGYRLAEATGATFARCDDWGEAGMTVRTTMLRLMLDYSTFVCTYDTPASGMDLNKRIATAIGSLLGWNRRMLRIAIDHAKGAHPAVLQRLEEYEQSLDLLEDGEDASRGDTRLVPSTALREWRQAMDVWTMSTDHDDEAPPEVLDVIAAWTDALRVAGEERCWDGVAIDEIVEDIGQLEAIIVPTAMERAGDVGVRRLAIALTKLLLVAPRETEVGKALAMHLRAGLVVVSQHGTRARQAVVDWAVEQQRILPREVLQLLTPTDEGWSDRPNHGSLFDGIDVDGLSDSENIRRNVQIIITRVLESFTDSFVVDLQVEEESRSYLQGLLEDERTLHLELAHGSMLGVATPADHVPDLLALGWNLPDTDIPNYWQLVDVKGLDRDLLAERMVRSMELAHDPFNGLPEDALLEIMPAALGNVVLPDDASIHSIDLDGDGTYIRVALPTGLSSGLMPEHVIEEWAVALRSVRIRASSRHGLVSEAAEALAAAARAGERLRAVEGGGNHAAMDSALVLLERLGLIQREET